MLTGDELAILLFWVSLAVGAGYEAVNAETYPRRIFFDSIAAFFLLIGLFWRQIKGVWPPRYGMGNVSRYEPRKLVLVVLVCGSHRLFWCTKAKRQRSR
jgi:hypothetical protein